MLIPRSLAWVAIAGVACGSAQPGASPTCDQPGDVRSDEAAMSLRACRSLPQLSISGGAAIDLSSLATLERIDGDLVVGPSSRLGTLNLAGLTRIGGSLRMVGNFELSGVFLGSLETVEGTVEIRSNTSLVGLSFAALRRVGGDLRITANPDLQSLLAPRLDAVAGALEIRGSRELAIIELSHTLDVRGETHIESPNHPVPGRNPVPNPQSPTPTLPE